MFKSKNAIKQPIPRGMYAWTSIHAGSFLLFAEHMTNCYKFIFLPGPSDFFLTAEDFDRCLNTKVLEFVEQLPEDIYKETIEFSLSSPPNTQKVPSNENN